MALHGARSWTGESGWESTMVVSPEELSQLIGLIAVAEAARAGAVLSSETIVNFSRIPSNYASRKSLPIDLTKLDEAISAIITPAAGRLDRAIGERRISERLLNEARDRAECHYLWFC